MVRGFTLIEAVVIVGIIGLLLTLIFSSLYLLRGRADLTRASEDILSSLRLARSKTLASDEASSYGVHLESNKYALFRGTSYSSSASDNRIFNVSGSLEIYNINFSGWPDIVFRKITGAVDSSKTGKFGVRLTANPSEGAIIINVKSSGEASILSSEIPFGNARITDSRHVHFSYSRIITITTENLVLTFSDSPNPDVIENIPMRDYTSGGKFDWQAKVSVGGEEQVLRVHTHILNDAEAGTVFSVHRDRRHNTKALIIAISGDVSGSLISYTAAGQESRGMSLNVSSPIRQ